MPLSSRLALELFLLRGTADPAENAPLSQKGAGGILEASLRKIPLNPPFQKGDFKL